MFKNIIFIFILFFVVFPTIFADEPGDPCGGPNALLSLNNRPSVADSACVIPKGHISTEMGLQYLDLLYGGYQRGGYAKVFPQTEIRVGMPSKSEISWLVPNYYLLTVQPRAGFSTTGIKIKHEFAYGNNLLSTGEVVFVFPAGSASFGSQSAGAILNGIFSYNFTSTVSVAAMLGLATLSTPQNSGGQRYNTFNPDVIASWLPSDVVQVYLEFFGQTRTGPGLGSGFNTDAGIVYLVSKNMTLDFSVGQRISGLLGGYNHYVGVGGVIHF